MQDAPENRGTIKVNSTQADAMNAWSDPGTADQDIGAPHQSHLPHLCAPTVNTLTDQTWVHKQYATGFVITALSSLLMALSAIALRLESTSFILAPPIILSTYMAFLLFNRHAINSRVTLFSDSLNGQLSLLIFILATYCGITAGLLLHFGGTQILSSLTIWITLSATSLCAIGRISFSHIIATFTLFFLPLTVMLTSTGDPYFITLALLYITASIGVVYAYTSIQIKFSKMENAYEAQNQTIKILQDRHSDFLQQSRSWGWESDEHHHLSFLTPNFESLTNIPANRLITPKTSQPLKAFEQHLDEKDWQSLEEKIASQASFNNLEVKFYPEGYKNLQAAPQNETCLERPFKVYTFSVRALYNQENELTGYRGWAVDITQSATFKEKQKTFQTTLERKVLFRTKILHEEISNLNTEKTHYEKQVSAQGKLITNISTRIHYSAQKISHAAQQFTRENRNFALIESKSLQHLAENIPYLVTMETKINENTNMIVSLDDLVRETVHALNHQAKSKSINLIFPTLSGLEVFGNATMLRKALYEIGLNAISYSPANSSITIKVMNNSRGINISVYDHGLEINPAIIEHVTSLLALEKIGFLDMIIEEHGMGLSIAAKMIHMHNGTLIFERKDNNQGNITSIHLNRARLLNG